MKKKDLMNITEVFFILKTKRHCDSMERNHNAFIHYVIWIAGILQIFGRSGAFKLIIVCFDTAVE